uniref:Uncharacterized protein n=1 Tax=Solanum lycopersicum TaxID=4081 RepID=A0A3Q7I163_SOLLC|nr:uncharacterized protein LOC104649041 [Solanum lycopersicum]
MESKKMINSPRKRIRKYHTRKTPIINSYTDMAEARREIVHALHLHRSSSFNNPNNYALLGQRVNSQQYYYSIVESMPIPQPTWSTTAPAIHKTPPPPSPLPPSSSGDVTEFDWWLGFLKSLDLKKNTSEVENILMENSKVISQLQDGLKKDATNNLIDEWLIIPTADDDDVLIEF